MRFYWAMLCILRVGVMKALCLDFLQVVLGLILKGVYPFI